MLDSSSGDEGSDATSSVPSTVGTPSVLSETNTAEMLARKETQRVLCSKMLVVSVLIVCAALVSATTYTFTKTGEQDDFKRTVGFYLKC